MAQVKAQVEWDLGPVRAWLEGHRKQAPFAISRALNDAAFSAKDSISKAASSSFDRPTAFIAKGWRVKRASKQDLEAVVHPAPKRDPYLTANVRGGQRGVKPFEGKFNALGGGSAPASKYFPTSFQRKNNKGNVSQAALRKIIDSASAGTTGRGSFFIGRPKNQAKPYGIYRRMARSVRPVFLAATKPMTYSPIYPIQEIGMKVVDRRFEGYLRRRMEQALRTAR